MDNGKVDRTLGIYTRLMGGYVINKFEEAHRYGVNERTIQRDIDDIRNFLENEVENTDIINSVIYDRNEKGYKLEQVYQLKLSNSEILAICKILLDRLPTAIIKDEMEDGYLIEAEVFGEGINMWLRSQGNLISDIE